MEARMDDRDNIILDADTLDRITEELARGETAGIDALFLARGAPKPLVLPRPEEADLKESRLVDLYRYWRALPTVDGVPRADMVDPIDVASTLRIVMLLEVVERGRDFRYLIYGQEIAERFGENMRGRLTSEMPVPANVSALFIGGYRAVLGTRAPLLTEHAAPPTVSVTQWRRLILPLAGPDGEVIQILVGNLPGTWRKPS
jgi:hypothetical protein